MTLVNNNENEIKSEIDETNGREIQLAIIRILENGSGKSNGFQNGGNIDEKNCFCTICTKSLLCCRSLDNLEIQQILSHMNEIYSEHKTTVYLSKFCAELLKMLINYIFGEKISKNYHHHHDIHPQFQSLFINKTEEFDLVKNVSLITPEIVDLMDNRINLISPKDAFRAMMTLKILTDESYFTDKQSIVALIQDERFMNFHRSKYTSTLLTINILIWINNQLNNLNSKRCQDIFRIILGKIINIRRLPNSNESQMKLLMEIIRQTFHQLLWNEKNIKNCTLIRRNVICGNMPLYIILPLIKSLIAFDRYSSEFQIFTSSSSTIIEILKENYLFENHFLILLHDEIKLILKKVELFSNLSSSQLFNPLITNRSNGKQYGIINQLYSTTFEELFEMPSATRNLLECLMKKQIVVKLKQINFIPNYQSLNCLFEWKFFYLQKEKRLTMIDLIVYLFSKRFASQFHNIFLHNRLYGFRTFPLILLNENRNNVFDYISYYILNSNTYQDLERLFENWNRNETRQNASSSLAISSCDELKSTYLQFVRIIVAEQFGKCITETFFTIIEQFQLSSKRFIQRCVQLIQPNHQINSDQFLNTSFISLKDVLHQLNQLKRFVEIVIEKNILTSQYLFGYFILLIHFQKHRKKLFCSKKFFVKNEKVESKPHEIVIKNFLIFYLLHFMTSIEPVFYEDSPTDSSNSWDLDVLIRKHNHLLDWKITNNTRRQLNLFLYRQLFNVLESDKLRRTFKSIHDNLLLEQHHLYFKEMLDVENLFVDILLPKYSLHSIREMFIFELIKFDYQTYHHLLGMDNGNLMNNPSFYWSQPFSRNLITPTILLYDILIPSSKQSSAHCHFQNKVNLIFKLFPHSNQTLDGDAIIKGLNHHQINLIERLNSSLTFQHDGNTVSILVKFMNYLLNFLKDKPSERYQKFLQIFFNHPISNLKRQIGYLTLGVTQRTSPFSYRQMQSGNDNHMPFLRLSSNIIDSILTKDNCLLFSLKKCEEIFKVLFDNLLKDKSIIEKTENCIANAKHLLSSKQFYLMNIPLYISLCNIAHFCEPYSIGANIELMEEIMKDQENLSAPLIWLQMIVYNFKLQSSFLLGNNHSGESSIHSFRPSNNHQNDNLLSFLELSFSFAKKFFFYNEFFLLKHWDNVFPNDKLPNRNCFRVSTENGNDFIHQSHSGQFDINFQFALIRIFERLIFFTNFHRLADNPEIYGKFLTEFNIIFSTFTSPFPTLVMNLRHFLIKFLTINFRCTRNFFMTSFFICRFNSLFISNQSFTRNGSVVGFLTNKDVGYPPTDIIQPFIPKFLFFGTSMKLRKLIYQSNLDDHIFDMFKLFVSWSMEDMSAKSITFKYIGRFISFFVTLVNSNDLVLLSEHFNIFNEFKKFDWFNIIISGLESLLKRMTELFDEVDRFIRHLTNMKGILSEMKLFPEYQMLYLRRTYLLNLLVTFDYENNFSKLLKKGKSNEMVIHFTTLSSHYSHRLPTKMKFPCQLPMNSIYFTFLSCFFRHVYENLAQHPQLPIDLHWIHLIEIFRKTTMNTKERMMENLCDYLIQIHLRSFLEKNLFTSFIQGVESKNFHEPNIRTMEQFFRSSQMKVELTRVTEALDFLSEQFNLIDYHKFFYILTFRFFLTNEENLCVNMLSEYILLTYNAKKLQETQMLFKSFSNNETEYNFIDSLNIDESSKQYLLMLISNPDRERSLEALLTYLHYTHSLQMQNKIPFENWFFHKFPNDSHEDQISLISLISKDWRHSISLYIDVLLLKFFQFNLPLTDDLASQLTISLLATDNPFDIIFNLIHRIQTHRHYMYLLYKRLPSNQTIFYDENIDRNNFQKILSNFLKIKSIHIPNWFEELLTSGSNDGIFSRMFGDLIQSRKHKSLSSYVLGRRHCDGELNEIQEISYGFSFKNSLDKYLTYGKLSMFIMKIDYNILFRIFEEQIDHNSHDSQYSIYLADVVGGIAELISSQFLQNILTNSIKMIEEKSIKSFDGLLNDVHLSFYLNLIHSIFQHNYQLDICRTFTTFICQLNKTVGKPLDEIVLLYLMHIYLANYHNFKIIRHSKQQNILNGIEHEFIVDALKEDEENFHQSIFIQFLHLLITITASNPPELVHSETFVNFFYYEKYNQEFNDEHWKESHSLISTIKHPKLQAELRYLTKPNESYYEYSQSLIKTIEGLKRCHDDKMNGNDNNDGHFKQFRPDSHSANYPVIKDENFMN
ncbi:hypothetical protein SNEBB_001318 [Seison nebaliae]|nr:hypothetical protein SNEBB_001318 [Seison nebaliae]